MRRHYAPSRRLCLFVGLALTLVLHACGAARPTLPTQAARARELVEPAPEFGGSVSVLEAGDVNAPPLLLIHGLGPGSTDFYPLLPTLSAHYHVLAFDLPGFGRSTHAKQLYTPERYARFFHEMVKRHLLRSGVGSVAVLAHSMGGALAIEYAARFPSEVHKLALLDVAGLFHYRAYTRMVIGDTPAHHSVWQRVRRRFNRVLFAVGSFPLQGLDLQSLELSESSLLTRTLSSEQLAAISFIRHDFGPALRAVQADTWLGWGSFDTVAPLRSLDALRYALRAKDYLVFDGSAHNPMRSEPDAVLRAVQRFLAAPITIVQATPNISARYGLCDGAAERIFEGDYDTIDLNNCKSAQLRDVRVRKLRIERSTVVMTRVLISSEDVAITSRGSRIRWTGGQARGLVCLDGVGNQLDFMAVDLDCPTPWRTRKPSRLDSSLGRMQAPGGYSALHGEYVLPRTFDEPLPPFAVDMQRAEGADRGRVELHGGQLAEAHLRGQHLADTALNGALLTGADLRRANLQRAQLQGTDIREAHLARADLREADLSRANLSGSNLVGAQLQHCNLRDATLSGANLRDADLSYANISGVDLTRTRIDRARFTGARYDQRTRFPRNFDPARHGLLLTD